MTTPQGPRAKFCVLGPLRVVVDGVEVAIATRRQRALLVLLLLNVGRVVPTERLVDQLWDGTPPPQGAVTLRSYVSNLRQALGGRDGLGGALRTRDPGYLLDVPPEWVDAVLLRRLTEQGREHLRQGDPGAALRAFEEAVASWSGDPLAEIADHEAARSTVTQLTETYLAAAEGRFEALLATGRHVDAVPGLEAFCADHPLREEPRALLMLALYRSGRAPEALEVHRRFRDLLDDELGIDPSARLERLHQQVLQQDPTLAAPAPDSTAVTDPQPPPPGPRAHAALVGRDHELATVAGHLDGLVRGTGGLLLVGGEPGIGKSTLLEHLEDDARRRGLAVHRGRAPSAAGAPAFWPWSQVVDSVAETLDDGALARATAGSGRSVAQLSADVAHRTGHPVPLTGDDLQGLRFQLYEAVSTFLRRAADGRPAVVTLDDMHWADLPSLELLTYLTPTLAERPVLLVVAYRDLPADRTTALDDTLATISREDAVHELVLTGLARDDVAALTHDLLDVVEGHTREEWAAVLHERTGGNPFFVRQLARLMVESGAADPGTSPVPPGVRHVIASRLRMLPERTRDLLAAAAVVGREFDLRTVARVSGAAAGEALDAADEAARHGLVEPSAAPGTRRFVHALVQEVVLDELPAGRAARLHAGVAAQLRADGVGGPERLAEHLWAARDVVGADAVDAQVEAARASAAVFAHERAEGYLRRALELAHADPDADAHTELTVLLSLFRLITAVRGWGDEEIRGVVDRALELTGTDTLTDTTARLWWSLFFYLLDRDDPSYVTVVDRLTATLDEADRSGRAVDHAARVTVHLGGVLAELDRDDRDAAREHLRRARVHVEAAPSDSLAAYDEHLHVMLLVTEGYWAALHGDADGHRAAIEAAVALADADGRPFPRAVARTLGAAGTPYLSDPARHLALAVSALEVSERFGFRWLVTLAGCLAGWAGAYAGGSADDAAERIEAVLHDLDASGRNGNLSSLRLLLADVRLVQGRPEDARASLLAAREAPGPYRGLVVQAVDRRLAALP